MSHSLNESCREGADIFYRCSQVLARAHLMHNCYSIKKGTNLSNFLDLAATFPDEGSTLASRHHDTQSHWRLAGCCAVGHGTADILKRNSRMVCSEASWFYR